MLLTWNGVQAAEVADGVGVPIVLVDVVKRAEGERRQRGQQRGLDQIRQHVESGVCLCAGLVRGGEKESRREKQREGSMEKEGERGRKRGKRGKREREGKRDPERKTRERKQLQRAI
jgi:hypothetical protein